MSNTQLLARIEALEPDERKIVEAIVERLEMGRKQYGAWNVNDGRDYEAETLAELLDGCAYLAAEIVRRRSR